MNNTATPPSNPTAKAPVSERKASANRANAQHSTGPKTPQGKARSALNALRHGILARAAFNVVLEGEERRAEFDAMVAGLAQEFQPQTMSEHLTVQQLAGCYWRLEKVWRYEQEAAWRTSAGPAMPSEEIKEYDKADLQLLKIRNTVMQQQRPVLEAAGLVDPIIPTGAAARTIMRYQSAIGSMLFRCLAILERRRKERMASEAAFEEVDYINEATEATSSEEKAEEPGQQPAPSPKQAENHKRTQKDVPEAPVSSREEAKSGAETPAADARSCPDPDVK
jgi:hypothetical protein